MKKLKKEENNLTEKFDNIRDRLKKIKEEINKVIVGQEEAINQVLLALICGGHVLLEGFPGLGKTSLLKSLSETMGCSVKRIQFTADLLPSDIVGAMTFISGKELKVMKGPIFTNFLLADEINRASPKTQSALLEAMQEQNVTIGKSTFKLNSPFFVMATQNNLESIGVYPLPEAQVDRFLFKINMGYPSKEEEIKVLSQNSTLRRIENLGIKKIISPEELIKFQKLTKNVFSSDEIKEYIVNIISKTRDKSFKYAKYISSGASPRASIAFYIASKAKALFEGRDFVLPSDVRYVAYPILRHRIILNYEASAIGIEITDVIKEIIHNVTSS